MPTLHNPDWNSLKLSDFPQFACLCELCDCGCFERTKGVHSIQCKKRPTQISNAFESNYFNKAPFQTNSIYVDTYKSFQFDTARNSASSARSSLDMNVSIVQMPSKIKPKEANIELPEKNIKLGSNTTVKDHFRDWQGKPATAAPKYPVLAGDHIYPNKVRNMVTTNKELIFKDNIVNAPLQLSTTNLFIPSYPFNQGDMTLNTVYRDVYDQDFSAVLKNRATPVKRAAVESKYNKMTTERIQVDHKTHNMLSFTYDPQQFRSSYVNSKSNNKKDMFKSKLQNNLKPMENVVDESSSSLKDENKNFKFISSFDGAFIPSLKAIKILQPTSRSQQRTANGTLRTAQGPRPDSANEPRYSTYNDHYKGHGVHICMAKAYNILQQQKNNVPRTVKTAQNASTTTTSSNSNTVKNQAPVVH